jgi:curved DNA-binding protein CbpA
MVAGSAYRRQSHPLLGGPGALTHRFFREGECYARVSMERPYRRPNWYQVLQVDPAADTDIISTVYRRLALRYHPDRDPSQAAELRMRELNQAYAVLKDPNQRARYDAELAIKRDRRATDRVIRHSLPPHMVKNEAYGEAGPPVGRASGSVLEFGRYRGWSLGQIAMHDPDFLEWLERSPAGRHLRGEIAKIRRTAPR